MGLRVAIVGAPGVVGRTLLRVLEERAFPVDTLRAFASGRQPGRSVVFRGEQIPVEAVGHDAFRGLDLVFIAAGDNASRALAPEAVRAGAVVVDKSNAFRMDPDVPLVVPEVNPGALEGRPRLVANPNCSTIQMVTALAPLHRRAGLQSVTVATYQAVSGSGGAALTELRAQTGALLAGEPPRPAAYPQPIAFNVLAECGGFGDDGDTSEERKLTHESRKILGLPDLDVRPLAVRVPVAVGHSEAVWAEFNCPLPVEEARALLAGAPGLELWDGPPHDHPPTPQDAEGRDDVLVGRVRQAGARNRLALWVVGDNLRKGAATNGVQIAEELIKRGGL